MSTVTNSNDPTKVSDVSVYAYEYSLPDMPQELIHYILHSLGLGVENTCACSLVNRKLYQMTCNEDLWRMLFQRDFNLPNCNQSFCKAYQIQSNIINEVYASYPFQRHMQGATAIITVDGKVFVGCNDNTIKIWDTETGNCSHILRGHKLKINALAVWKEKLFSGSDDGTMKCWDLKTGKCITSKINGKVTHLIVDNERLFCGCSQARNTLGVGITTHSYISELNFKTGAYIRRIVVDDTLQNFAISGDVLYGASGNAPKTVWLWDLKNNCKERESLTSPHNFHSFAVVDEKMFLAFDKSIKHFDLKTRCQGTFFHGGNPSSPLAESNGMLFLGFTSGTILLKKDHSRGFLLKNKNTGIKINALSFANGKLFSTSFDQGCTVYDFRPELRTIFAEVLDLFRSDSRTDYILGCQRFRNLPKRVKDTIYEQLYLIMKPFKNDYRGCAEDAFFCKDEKSTSEQRIQAIENYLKLEYPNEPYSDSEYGSYFEEVEDDHAHYPPLMQEGIAAAQGVYELFASRSLLLSSICCPGCSIQ